MEVFVGNFVHSTNENPMIILSEHVMGVRNSRIEFVEDIKELENLKADFNFTEKDIYYMKPNQFLMPGFIDTHIHAPQYPNNGLSIGLPLLQWLEEITFPMETSFQDAAFARNIYNIVVDRLLRNGTTTATYFATIHLNGTKALVDAVCDKGQRALIGKVNQMINCPDNYKENSVKESVEETEELILYIKDTENKLVLPIITPRFAPTCPEDQLIALGELAKKHCCHIQSHLAESKAEVNWVKKLFPWSKSYTEVYDRMQLLTEKTVMAHCIWMNEEELDILRERRTGVSLCPNSNISMLSGICDSKRLMSHGINVGLGTDCSGGSSSSLLDALRLAVQSSNILAMDRDDDFIPLTIEEAFKFATLGGAKVLNLESKIGNFDIGKEFDALLIDSSAVGSQIDIFQRDCLKDKIKKFLMGGDDRNIIRVYVSGKRIVDLQLQTSS